MIKKWIYLFAIRFFSNTLGGAILKMVKQKMIITIVSYVLDNVNDNPQVQETIKGFGSQAGKEMKDAIPGEKIEPELMKFASLFFEGFENEITK